MKFGVYLEIETPDGEIETVFSADDRFYLGQDGKLNTVDSEGFLHSLGADVYKTATPVLKVNGQYISLKTIELQEKVIKQAMNKIDEQPELDLDYGGGNET